MAAETINVDGRQYVAGLDWVAVESPGHFRAEAIEKASNKYDLVNFWQTTDGEFQFGFVTSNGGAIKPGAHALATALVSTLGVDWIGVFELGDGFDNFNAVKLFAFIAITGTGTVSRDVVGTLDEAKAQWIEYVADEARFNRKIDAFYAPVAANLGHDVVSNELSDLLRRRVAQSKYAKLLRLSPHQSARLEAIRPPAKGVQRVLQRATPTSGGSIFTVQNIVAGTVAAAVVAWAVMDWMGGHRKHAAPAQAVVSTQSTLLPRHKKQAIPPPPWKNLADGQTFMAVCSVAYEGVNPVEGAWTLDDAECKGGQMTMNYSRYKEATDNAFIAAVKADYGVVPTFDAGHAKGTVVVPIGGMAASGEELAHDDVLHRVYSHFQALNVPIASLALETVNDPAPAADEDAAVFPWKVYDLSITKTNVQAINTKNFLSQLLTGLDVPGFRLTSIKAYRTDAKPYVSWDITGKIYVAR